MLRNVEAEGEGGKGIAMAHFIRYCSECDRVMESCRCTKPNKHICYGICPECNQKEKEER